jgi:hypothetical protein
MFSPESQRLVKEITIRAARLMGAAMIVSRQNRLLAALREFAIQAPHGTQRDLQIFGNRKGAKMPFPSTKKSSASPEREWPWA